MKRYRVKSPISLFTGEVGLTKEQAKVRLAIGRIKETEESGIFNIIGQVDFKAGEEISLNTNSGIQDRVECLDPDEAITSSSTVKDIRAALDEQGIEYDQRTKKAELLELLNEGGGE